MRWSRWSGRRASPIHPRGRRVDGRRDQPPGAPRAWQGSGGGTPRFFVERDFERRLRKEPRRPTNLETAQRPVAAGSWMTSAAAGEWAGQGAVPAGGVLDSVRYSGAQEGQLQDADGLRNVRTIGNRIKARARERPCAR